MIHIYTVPVHDHVKTIQYKDTIMKEQRISEKLVWEACWTEVLVCLSDKGLFKLEPEFELHTIKKLK